MRASAASCTTTRPTTSPGPPAACPGWWPPVATAVPFDVAGPIERRAAVDAARGPPRAVWRRHASADDLPVGVAWSTGSVTTFGPCRRGVVISSVAAVAASASSAVGSGAYEALVAGLRDRDVRRAVTWLQNAGGLLPLPLQAGDLLAVRLASRARIASRWGGALGGVVVALLLGWVWLWVLDDVGVAPWSHSGVATLVCLLVVVASVLEVALARARTSLARVLPRRVAREVRAPVTVVLGRPAAWWMVVASGLAVFYAVALLTVRPGWASLPRGLAALLSVAYQGVAVVTQVRREALALDVPSLLLDERLRSQDARHGLSLLPFALVVCLVGPDDPASRLPDPVVTAGLGLALLLILTTAIVLCAWAGPPGDRWTSPIRELPPDRSS